MNEQQKIILIAIHFSLFVLQLGAVGLAIGVNPNYSGLSPVIGAAQSFFPNPFKEAL